MPITPRNMLAVFAGGAIGTAMRWAVGEGLLEVGASAIVSLVIVNVIGSFALGWFVVGDRSKVHHINGLFAIGLLGSFTTFSGYAVSAVDVIDKGSVAGGLALALGSIALGFAAAIAGRVVGVGR
jgi:fluoride exporter